MGHSQKSSLMNMVARCWEIVKNMIVNGPAVVLRVVWRIAELAAASGVWVVRMAGLVFWRSFWWAIGACLRARGVKPVAKKQELKPARVNQPALHYDSDELTEEPASSDSEGSERGISRRLHKQGQNRSQKKTVECAATGENWGYITGETREPYYIARISCFMNLR